MVVVGGKRLDLIEHFQFLKRWDVDDSLFRDWRYARSLVHQVLEGRTLKDLSILLEPGGLHGKDHGCADRKSVV